MSKVNYGGKKRPGKQKAGGAFGGRKNTTGRTFPDFLAEVWYSCLDRGGIYVAWPIIILLIWMIRVPEESLSELPDKLVELLADWHLLGWALFIVTLLFSQFLLRKVRRLSNLEEKRL